MRVLVCGTNYGSLYLEALRLGGKDYRLAGILARGNTRSQLAALEYDVPLFRSLEEVGSDIDFACAAMGASGNEVVLGLIARDIHVLCEHPLNIHYVQSALDAARARRICFHINGHFAQLEAATAFISHARQRSQAELPSFFQVTATDRSLYAALDILGRIRVYFTPFQFQVTGHFAEFIELQGVLAGVPATFHIQRGVDGQTFPDGSPRYLVDHRIVAVFPSGILTLLSMNGPVVWNANLNRSQDADQTLFTVLHENCSLTAGLLRRQRIASNFRAIEAIAKNIREGVAPPEQKPDYLLELSRAWETLGSLL